MDAPKNNTPKKAVARKRKAAPKKVAPKAPKKVLAPVAALIPPGIDARFLGRLARKAVLGMASKSGTGEERHVAAVAIVAKKVDSALVWPMTPAGLLAESLDGFVAKLLIGSIVKGAYDALKAEGKVL